MSSVLSSMGISARRFSRLANDADTDPWSGGLLQIRILDDAREVIVNKRSLQDRKVGKEEDVEDNDCQNEPGKSSQSILDATSDCSHPAHSNRAFVAIRSTDHKRAFPTSSKSIWVKATAQDLDVAMKRNRNVTRKLRVPNPPR